MDTARCPALWAPTFANYGNMGLDADIGTSFLRGDLDQRNMGLWFTHHSLYPLTVNQKRDAYNGAVPFRAAGRP